MKFADIAEFLEIIERKLSARKQRLAPTSFKNNGHAAVLFPLFYKADASHVDEIYTLLEKRSSDLRHNPGDMAFPGGKRDKNDKTLFHTACREALEEVGIDPQKVKNLGLFDEFVSSSGKIVHPFIGAIEEDTNQPLEKYLNKIYFPKTSESESVAVIPITHFLKPEYYISSPYEYQLGKEYRRGYLRYIDISKYLPNTTIWGLTASIIRRFVDTIFPQNNLPAEPVE